MPGVDEILQRLQGLYSAAICDALDELGLWTRAMDRGISPLVPTARIVGRARTILACPAPELGRYRPDTYRRWALAYDRVSQGEVLVIATGAIARGAVWGELRTARLRTVGAAGLVTDGLVRDCSRIIQAGFPVFCAGRSPEDCRGRIEFGEADITVTCGGVQIRPGDYLLGDLDGVVVVPQEVVVDVIQRAEDKDRIHAWIHERLRSGVTAQEVVQSYLNQNPRNNVTPTS
jgi:4-hydroxy-4-methyl-2-oxoglutarate aldolase